jgi:chemotaxis protein methyltransferase CheR
MPIHPFQLTQATTLIEQRTGLSAETLQRIRIGELLEQTSAGDVEALLQRLHHNDENHPDWQRLIHALTIGETYFLRDKRHFDILRENILPRLMLARRRVGDLRMTIWCVGCATGEEPYSIATVLQEFLADFPRWQITILGTDLNQRAIDAARQAVYRQWSFRHTPEGFINRYFSPVDESSYQLIKPIRNMVTFRQHNLMDGAPLYGADIVFCRNVLMYFNNEFAQKAEQTLYQSLAPGGWLLLGQAEALHSRTNNWTMHLHPGTPIYQKPSGTQPLSAPISYPTKPFVEHDDYSTESEDANYASAIQAVHEDRPQRAEIYIGRLLAENPLHAKAHILLASIFANRQAYPEAQAHLDEALSVNGLLADAHYIRALIQLEQNETESAIQSLSAAIYCQRDHALAAFTLGNIYAQRNDTVRAEKNWRNARRALDHCNGDTYISDLSDMQVTAMQGLLKQRLGEENK